MNRKSWAAIAAVAILSACSSTDGGERAPTYGKTARFAARNEYSVKVPEGAKSLNAWFAMPQSNDTAQTIINLKIEASAPYRHATVVDSEGNEQIHVALDNPPAGEFKLVETFDVERREVLNQLNPAETRAYEPADLADKAEYLAADANVVIDDRIRDLSAKIVGAESNPIVKARLIYDWVLANIEYWVKDPKTKKASPVGSTTYCLESATGNCTDFHSLWTSLARAAGIPTRMKYGSFFKAELNGQDADQSYHCWPEFWVPNYGWVPHDVAVADIFTGNFATTPDNEKPVRLTTADGYTGKDEAKVNYYFGSIEERRVTWSVGRDLALTPKQAGGPVNALPKAYVEIDGKPQAEKEVWTRKLTYRQM